MQRPAKEKPSPRVAYSARWPRQTAVFDLFHLAVALLYLPAFTVAQASYYDTARETNPIPQPPRLPEE